MGGNYPGTALLIKPFEYRLGNGTSQHGLGARTEFVYQHQGSGSGVPEKKFHVHQVGTVGAEVVFDGLFIAYINEDTPEKPENGTFGNRHQEAALKHILQQTYGLKAYRFTTGIGPGNEKYTILLVEPDT